MTEELMQFDADLKGLFVENKLEEMIEQLEKQPEELTKELAEYNWNIIKKYYEEERFELLFQHLKFVAYTCFIIEYAHKTGIITEEAFQIMMMVYNDIYEMKRQNG
jgi:hypothetical protein